MTISRQEKLQLAMANARQILGQENITSIKSKSQLNRLRNDSKRVDEREGNLITRTKVNTRPTFDIIADRVLGEDTQSENSEYSQNKITLAKIAAQRMNKLRDEKEILEIDDDMFGEELGLLKDGKPIWTEVLDNQRGYSINMPELDFKDSTFKPEWPPILRISNHNTWKTWSVLEENSRASGACEKIVEKPGNLMNPLLILANEGCGKSHILHATSQAMIRRQDGNVHLISVSRLASENRLPNGWQDAVSHANLVAIDDLHLAQNRLATELGLLIDYALNMGVQIIATSRTEAKDWGTSRLWEVMKSATNIWMMNPSSASLITHLRRKTVGRALLLDDSMLATIVLHGGKHWRSVDAAFEKIALAIESGERIISPNHISSILESAPMPQTKVEEFVEKQTIEEVASKVITDTLDHLYSDTVFGGVELKSKLPELSDDWEVPEINIDSNKEIQTELVDGNLLPHSSNTLTVDERDEYLLEDKKELEAFDQVRVDETVTSIDKITDNMFEGLKQSHLESSEDLASLELELIHLAEVARKADVDELIQIADRIGEIEYQLGNVSHAPIYTTLKPIKKLKVKGES